ncbi:hypothetical protein V2J09_018729 [Rumex salicifolius]
MSWTGGDWMCGACQHSNFKKRDSCQKCGFPKSGGPADVSAYLQSRTEVLAGDWYCQTINCGAHNYASRASCYRCGSLKMAYSAVYGANVMQPNSGFETESLIPGWKSGQDAVCTIMLAGQSAIGAKLQGILEARIKPETQKFDGVWLWIKTVLRACCQLQKLFTM